MSPWNRQRAVAVPSDSRLDLRRGRLDLPAGDRRSALRTHVVDLHSLLSFSDHFCYRISLGESVVISKMRAATGSRAHAAAGLFSRGGSSGSEEGGRPSSSKSTPARNRRGGPCLVGSHVIGRW